MVIREFVQRKGLLSRKFILKNDRLVVREKTMSDIIQYEVMLDRIGYEKLYKAENTLLGKIFTIACFLIPFYTLYLYLQKEAQIESLIICVVLCWLMVIISLLRVNKDDVILIGGAQPISFYRNKPNEQLVSSFIDEVITTSKEYMKIQFLKFEDYSSKEEYWNVIRSLKRMNVLTEKEFSLLKEEFGKEFF